MSQNIGYAVYDLTTNEEIRIHSPKEYVESKIIEFKVGNYIRKVLLEQLSPKLEPSFKKLKNQICKDHPDGFYVRAKPNLCSPDITIKYISRYLGRPVISTFRLDAYDGEETP